MKKVKKIVALMLAAVMMLAMGVTALAEGSGSITVLNASAGQKYNVYKIFDASYNETTKTTAYYLTGTKAEGASEYSLDDNIVAKTIKEAADSPFTISNNADAQGRFAVDVKADYDDDKIIEWIRENLFVVEEDDKGNEISIEPIGRLDAAAEEITAGLNTPVITFENLEEGYYFVTSSLGATVTVNRATPDVNIFDKNNGGTPTEERTKKITAVNDETIVGGSVSESAAVGDIVSFEISFKARNFIEVSKKDSENNDYVDYEMIENYTVVDIPEGLDIDTDTIVITVNGNRIYYWKTEDENLVLQNDGKCTVEKASKYIPADPTNEMAEVKKGTVTITIPWAEATGNMIPDVTDSEENDVPEYIPLYSAPATVVITYNAEVTELAADTVAKNTAKVGARARTIDGQTDDITPDPTPSDEVTTYHFDLVKTDIANIVLSGAEFELYTKKTDGEKINLVYVTNDTDGNALGEPYYRVATKEEEEASEFESAVIEAGNVTVKGLDGDKEYWLEEIKAPDGYNMLSERVKVSFIPDGKDDPVNLEAKVTEATDDTPVTYVEGGIEVENKAGSTLPTTGGMGTTIFYILGGILVLGAAVLLVTRRRMRGME